MTTPSNQSGAGSPAAQPGVAFPVAVGAGAAGLALAPVDVDVDVDVDVAAPEIDAAGDQVVDELQLDAGEEHDAPTEDEVMPAEVPDELPESARPSHLRVAPEIQRGLFHRRRRAQLLVLGVAAISAASMFLLVTFHVFAAQSAFSLDRLDSQLTLEQRQYGLLRDKVATLSSPDAVASGAKTLGMIRASQVTLLHPPAAPAFGATGSLPVPPPTPYTAIGDNG